MTRAFGRREPTDFVHVARYPFTAPAPITVERTLALPWWHTRWDQDGFGACVGHGTSMMLVVLNLAQRRAAGQSGVPRYDPWWLWNRAKDRDEWPETNAGDNEGTSVRAACDVLRDAGAVAVPGRQTFPAPAPWGDDLAKVATAAEGIAANRWARTVDEMRASIAAGVPISIGTNWYGGMSQPTKVGSRWFLKATGPLEGGHCVCVIGASDNLQAVKIKNSWGDFPVAWLPYEEMDRLLRENGEAALVTDR